MTNTKQLIATLFSAVALMAITSCGQMPSTKVEIPLQKTEVEILSLLMIDDMTEEFHLTFASKIDTTQKLIMLVGKYEAQTLAISMQDLKPMAPLPLDLFQEIIISLNMSVKEVLVDSLKDGIYTAKIICFDKNKSITLQARSIDAATIAVKFKCPIFIDNKLLTH